jgi:signal transduction histidine kinase
VQRAFARMNASMQALLERERSFTRYASHELRTPIGAIKVQLERVEIGAATAAEVLPAVVRQTRRIEELIDALLTLARAREVAGPVRALRSLLDEVTEALAEPDRHRVYLVDPVPDVGVRDAVLVAQALRNLIDNAVRHGAGPVAVRAEQDGGSLVLRVRDMGPGIRATELRRLADPVGHGAPRPDGHGLGLTLVALIARALDGRLLLHNTEIGLEASLTVRVLVAVEP